MPRYLILVLMFAGCTNPDDILVVRGLVSSIDTVEGQVVRLLRDVERQPNITDRCAHAIPLKETRADVDGEYGFEVLRVETRSACFRVEAAFSSGSVSWSDLELYSPETRLAPLLDWRAEPWLDGGVLAFQPAVPWPDDLPPARTGDTLRLGIQLTHQEQLVTSDGGLVWQAEDRHQVADASTEVIGYPTYVREPLVLDSLRVEDFDATLTLTASVLDPDQESGLVSSGPLLTRVKAGAHLALRGGRVPLSRGLDCPALGTPCPLTDGDLTEVDAGLIDEVALKLIAPAHLSAAVVRGAWVAGDRIRVLLTADDGERIGDFEGVLPGSDPAFANRRSVRVQQDAGYAFAQLQLAYIVIPLDAGALTSTATVQFPGGLAQIQEVSLFE